MITAKIFLNGNLISCLYARSVEVATDPNIYVYNWEYYKLIPVMENKSVAGVVLHKFSDGFEKLMLSVLDTLDDHSTLFMQNNVLVDKIIEGLIVEFAVNGAIIAYTTLNIVRNPPRDKIRGEYTFLYTWEHYIPEQELLKSNKMIEFDKEKESIEKLIAAALREIVARKKRKGN